MLKAIGLLIVIAAGLITSVAVITEVAFACQTNAEGCQKTQEGGTPAGDSPPEVSGCHFFDTQSCVRESTPP